MLTNADSNLTPEKRRQAEKDAKNDGIIQDAVARAEREGHKPSILYDDKQNFYATYDRLAEQGAFRSSEKPSLIPLGVRIGPQYANGIHWILSDADADAVRAGVYCPRCLEAYPELWAPACTVCLTDRDLIHSL
jgi:hypothetical protein